MTNEEYPTNSSVHRTLWASIVRARTVYYLVMLDLTIEAHVACLLYTNKKWLNNRL